MAARLDDGAVLVSATNGKTTTCAMVAGVLERHGQRVVHNRAGSNMRWGVATALLDAGREPGQLGLFEVDEAWLPRVAGELRPRVYLLSNLFRDQLDRYGELELLADRWAELVAAEDGRARFVLNADDPLVADLGREREGVVYFGLEDDSQALPELQHAADSKHCRNCGTPYVYEAVYLGHLGRYRCPNCGRKRPGAAGRGRAGRARGHGRRPGRHNNAPRGARTAASPSPGSTTSTTPWPPRRSASSSAPASTMSRRRSRDSAGAFGRVETIPVDGRDVSILLVKNPAGANEVLRTLTLEDGQLDLWLALNDRIADGRDVSWIWDADFELLRGRVRRATCSGTRAEEMALRLKYAGIDAELEVERDLGASLDAAVAAADGGRALRPAHLHRAARAARPARPARARPEVVGVIAARPGAVAWHDVECASYAADLPLWRELAEAGGRCGARPRLRHRPRGAATWRSTAIE